jgi:hypothetical protein
MLQASINYALATEPGCLTFRVGRSDDQFVIFQKYEPLLFTISSMRGEGDAFTIFS